MTVEIDNRLYNNIVQWCEANGIETIKYIEKTLRERLATDKYGDLNEKINKDMAVQTEENVNNGRNVEEIEAISPDRKETIQSVSYETVPKKKVDNDIEEPLAEAKEVKPKVTIQKEEQDATEASVTKTTTVRKKRTLKTK